MKKLIMALSTAAIVVTGCSNEDAKQVSKESKDNKAQQEQKAEKVQIKRANIEKSGDRTLKVTTKAVGEKLTYAYYVYKDNEVIEKVPYKENSTFTYDVEEPGTYFVRVYAKDGNGEIDTLNTDEIKVER